MAWVNGTWVDEDDSTASKLTGLLDQNSDYIKQARRQGEAAAAKRGLLNSSIAAGSGQASAIAAALPIASQDASTAAQKNLTQANYDVQTKLNTQTGQQAQDLATLNNQAELERQRQNLEVQQKMQADTIASNEKNAALSSETTLQAAKINSSDQMTSAYLTALSNLGQNKDLSAADRNAYIAEMQRVTGQTQALRNALSSVTLAW